MLAHTLTVIRRRMKEGGQFIVAVEPPTGGNQMQIQAVQTPDGNSWWAAFTSFEEELKGSGSVMSTFLTGIEQAFRAVLAAEGAKGIINLDAIHDTVHEMARDEARHGKAFEGLLNRYFG